MTRHTMCPLLLAVTSVGGPSSADAAPAEKLRREQELLRSIQVRPGQLRPLQVDTDVVRDGEARAVICHADAPAWRTAAGVVRGAIKAATGADVRAVSDAALDPEELGRQNVILLGHLDNNRLVERLYHNFFVCLDVGYTGRTGYVIRSVHDPFGQGGNVILVGGSYAEGTAAAADAFARIVREQGRPGRLRLGRLLELRFDSADRQEQPVPPLNARGRDDAVRTIREMFASPGRGRSGVARLVESAVRYHRTGDPLQAETYRAGLLALLDYYDSDEYINQEGLGRYDRDFRDSWTHSVCITWDLLEETGLFSDQQRLAAVNLLITLALECVVYQRWDRPESVQRWAENDDIVHNHNTFPALGVHFVGTYLKRHYGSDYVDDWLTVARGIFQGQKHVIYAHSATVGCAADLDGDGKDEVVAGNAYYQLNLIDHDGGRMVRADRFGPEQTAAAAGDLDRDGTPEVLIGTDGGELICFDPGGKRRWTANVGDKVTRILTFPPEGTAPGRVVCAAESAHLFCFDSNGETMWRTALGGGVTDVAVFRSDSGDRLAAAAGADGLVVMGMNGGKLAVARTRGRALRLAVIGGRIVVATDRGELESFDVTSDE